LPFARYCITCHGRRRRPPPADRPPCRARPTVPAAGTVTNLRPDRREPRPDRPPLPAASAVAGPGAGSALPRDLPGLPGALRRPSPPPVLRRVLGRAAAPGGSWMPELRPRLSRAGARPHL
jgi:hypothetical protein